MIGSLIKSLFGGSESEVEIPDWMGEILSSEDDLLKGAGHKYIRRIPTGNPKKPWKYFYKVSGGSGLGHHSEFVEGAAFKVAHNGKEGHFHILGVEGDKLKIKHDETGEESTLTKDALTSLLHKEHAQAIGAHKERLKKELVAVSQHGSEKQKAKIQKEADKAGVSAVKDPFDDISNWRGADVSEEGVSALAEVAARNNPFDFSAGPNSDEYKRSMERFRVLQKLAGRAHIPSYIPTASGSKDFTRATSAEIYEDLLLRIRNRQIEDALQEARENESYKEILAKYGHVVDSAKDLGVHVEQSGPSMFFKLGSNIIHRVDPMQYVDITDIEKKIAAYKTDLENKKRAAAVDDFTRRASSKTWRSGSLGKSNLAINDRGSLVHKPSGGVLISGLSPEVTKKIGSALHTLTGDLPDTIEAIKADSDKVKHIRWLQENVNAINKAYRDRGIK